MITNGTVRFLKRMKTGDYEHEEAQVELVFNVPDGADDGAYHNYLNRATQEALSKVRVMLGLSGPVTQEAVPIRKPKPEPSAEVKAVGNAPEPSLASVLDMETAKAEEHKAASGEPMDDMWSAATPEINDKALTDACAARNAQLKDPKGTAAIRKLIATYVPPPGQVRQIPQARRQEFLDALKAIKVDAA